MAKRRKPNRRAPAKRRPAPRGRQVSRTSRRSRPSPRMIAALAVLVFLVAAVLLVALTRGDSNPATASAPATGSAQIGGDLHSVVAVADGRVYVGGHAAVALTKDGGRTWSEVPTLANADAMGWGVQGRTIFVSGHPGINRSDDDGATFRRANGDLRSTDVHGFGAGPGVLYAAGPGIGVAASTDGGTTWQPRSSDTGRAFFGRILVDQANGDHLIAADAQKGAVASTDGGRTWRALGGSGGAVWVSSPDGAMRTLLVSGSGGAVISTDGGGTWAPLRLPAGASLVEAVPGQPTHLLAAGLQGAGARLWTSNDSGATWN